MPTAGVAQPCGWLSPRDQLFLNSLAEVWGVEFHGLELLEQPTCQGEMFIAWKAMHPCEEF